MKRFVLEHLQLLSDVAQAESVHREGGTDICQKDLFKDLKLEPVKELKDIGLHGICKFSVSVINLILAYFSDHSAPFSCSTISLNLSLITVIFL